MLIIRIKLSTQNRNFGCGGREIDEYCDEKFSNSFRRKMRLLFEELINLYPINTF